MWERLISSVVRGDYYVWEVNIICCKRGLLCGRGEYHVPWVDQSLYSPKLRVINCFII